MTDPVPFENAVDLLDADHKLVKNMFIEYDAFCEDETPAEARQTLAVRICQALTIHARIEEEIFYPAVRKALDDEELIDDALAEHAEAKALIAQILDMDPSSADYDATVKELALAIDEHVLEEREEIFVQAQVAPLDLRALAVPLYLRKKELQAAAEAPPRAAGKAKGAKASKAEVKA